MIIVTWVAIATRYGACAKSTRNDSEMSNGRESHWNRYGWISTTETTINDNRKMFARLSHGNRWTGNQWQFILSASMCFIVDFISNLLDIRWPIFRWKFDSFHEPYGSWKPWRHKNCSRNFQRMWIGGRFRPVITHQFLCSVFTFEISFEFDLNSISVVSWPSKSWHARKKVSKVDRMNWESICQEHRNKFNLSIYSKQIKKITFFFVNKLINQLMHIFFYVKFSVLFEETQNWSNNRILYLS